MSNISNSKDLVEKKETKEILEDEEKSFSYAMQLITSMALPMALNSAIELGVFEVLQNVGKDSPLSANEIVSHLSSINNPKAPQMLDRILTLLASHSILNCSILTHKQNHINSFHRCYSMTPVSKLFALNSDGVSLAPFIALTSDTVYLNSWPQLKDAIRENGTPFKRVHGTHLYDYLNIDSRFNQVFNTAMTNHTTIVMKKVLENYKDFKDVKRLVDVGGGIGMNINMITSKYTHMHGVNFDLPHVIQHAPSYPRVEHMGGDMLESVPKGDAIFLKWILHNWSDEHCLKILKNCYDSIPDDGKVIVLEALRPKIGEVSKFNSQIDVFMMTSFQEGKERTKEEFMELATKVGFSGIRYECCTYNIWVMEFFK